MNNQMVDYTLKNITIMKKGSKAKIWKLNEYYYTGDIDVNNEFNGSGIITYYNENPSPLNVFKTEHQDVYQGEFKNNLRDGNGILYSKNGIIKYNGLWKNNEPIGKITCYIYDNNNNKKYYGEVEDGKYNGIGLIFENDRITQFGEYKNGLVQKSLDFYCDNKHGMQIKQINYKHLTEDDIIKLFDYKTQSFDTLKTIYANLTEPYDKSKLNNIKHHLMDVNFTGKILSFHKDGYIIYKGCVTNNKFNGNGSLEIISSDSINTKYVFNGIFKNTLFLNGEINYRSSNGKLHKLYRGTFNNNGIDLNNQINLKFLLQSFNDGLYYYTINSPREQHYKYTGKFIEGKFSQGIIKKNNGRWMLQYNGTFSISDDVIPGIDYTKYHGYGVEYDNNENKKYEGYYNNGKYNGLGIFYVNGVKNYHGQFVNNMKHGDGKLLYRINTTQNESTSVKENIMYQGQFLNNKKNGIGILYNKNGTKEYEGSFLNDRKHGYGCLYDDNGNFIIECQFVNDSIC